MAERLVDKPAIIDKFRWIWDPVPPYLVLDQDFLKRYASLEIKFKIQELKIHEAKLEELSKMISKQ